MDQKFAFIFFGLCFPSCCLFSQYYYVNLKMTWVEAQQFCRQTYSDLASFESMDNITSLNRPNLVSSLTWIGMSDDPDTWKGVMGNESTSWRWSATGETSKTGYSKWFLGQPDNAHGEFCVAVNKLGQWRDWDCNRVFHFVCYDGNQTSDHITYKYINILKTFKDAQTYCRQSHTDLATIESSEENSKVAEIIPFLANAWIGLYRNPYSWSDKSQSSVRNWLPGRPDNFWGKQHCASENYRHDWEDLNCNKRLTFLCIGDDNLPAIKVEESRKAVVKIKVQADTDLSKASVSSQILKQLSEVLGSQGWANVTLQWRVEAMELKTQKKMELKTQKKMELKTQKKVELKTQKKMELKTQKKMEFKTQKKMELETQKKMELETQKKMELKTQKKMELKTQKKMELKTQESKTNNSQSGKNVGKKT